MACAYITRCPYCIDTHAKNAKSPVYRKPGWRKGSRWLNPAVGATMAHSSIAFKSQAYKQVAGTVD